MVSIKTGEKRIRTEAGDNPAADAENEFNEKKSKKMKKKKFNKN
jgi:hypothetical protein